MGNYEILVISVLSWVAGIFFWGLVDVLICPIKWIKQYIIKWKIIKYIWMCLSWCLNKIMKCCSCEVDVDNKKDMYYTAYYTVQERGLLGPVNILEGFSAFFRNFCFVSIYLAAIIKWGSLPQLFGPICVDCESCSCLCLCSCSCSCGKGSLLQISPCCAIGCLLLMAILSPFFRCIVEKKIQCTVLNAYKYIEREQK